MLSFVGLVQVGYVHRDARWENIACNLAKSRYFWLDLELCAAKDGHPPFTLDSWGMDTLVLGRYMAASDLHCLGKLLADYNHLVLSDSGRAFMKAVCQPAGDLSNKTAEHFLQLRWINCCGELCRAAGAQPNEQP